MKNNFVERLSQGEPIVTQGSSEAIFVAQGLVELPVEAYNLKNPIAVESSHRDFLRAGATLLITNSSRANRIALEPYRMDDKVYEINRKAAWLARSAANSKAYVAGAVGPCGKFLAPVGALTEHDIREAFREQITALLDGGVDVVMLRSFIDVRELEIAIEVARALTKLPVIAQKTFPEDGAVLATNFPRRVADRLTAAGAVAIGSDSTVGPQRMLGIIKSLYAKGLILSAQPDIGIPTLVGGRATYEANPDYVATSCKTLVEAGVTIIGVSGGGLPIHIKAICEKLAGVTIGSKATLSTELPKEAEEVQSVPEPSEFAKQLGKKFLVTVELDIPRGTDMSTVLEGARYLKANGIDAVNISDGARARLRTSSIAISEFVQQGALIEAMTHLACRDRNMVGLQSELLGATLRGVKNILAVTGDPAQIGDYPYATSVYDVDSIGLIRALSSMNKGCDLAGNPLGGRTNFLIACGANPVARNLDHEIARLERKVGEGAHVIFTQPIFERSTVEQFLERTRHLDFYLMIGVLPLRSVKHAEFLHHEVPGMFIPEWIHSRIAKAGKEASAEGVRIAVEFLREVKQMVDGVYLMPPFKKYDMAVEILRAIS